jgi:hypothetical protein
MHEALVTLFSLHCDQYGCTSQYIPAAQLPTAQPVDHKHRLCTVPLLDGEAVGAAVGLVFIAVGAAEVGATVGMPVSPYSPLAVQDRWHSRSIPQVASGLQHLSLKSHPHRRPSKGPLLVGKHSSVTVTGFSRHCDQYISM